MAGTPGLARRLACLVGSMLAAQSGLGGALAGDAAQSRFIGFSRDGHHLAFEQYGTLDWSDVASGYAHVFVLDTQSDAFAPGAPILVEDKRPDATLTVAEARRRAAAKAAPLIARLGLTRLGRLVANDPAAKAREPVAYADIPALLQDPPAPLALTGGGRLVLEPLALDDAGCTLRSGEAVTVGKALGFRLSIAGDRGRPPRLLHEDKAVPGARDCPIGYRLAEARLLPRPGAGDVLAVLIERFSQGYEGPDRRFLMVTGVLAP